MGVRPEREHGSIAEIHDLCAFQGRPSGHAHSAMLVTGSMSFPCGPQSAAAIVRTMAPAPEVPASESMTNSAHLGRQCEVHVFGGPDHCGGLMRRRVMVVIDVVSDEVTHRRTDQYI